MSWKLARISLIVQIPFPASPANSRNFLQARFVNISTSYSGAAVATGVSEAFSVEEVSPPPGGHVVLD